MENKNCNNHETMSPVNKFSLYSVTIHDDPASRIDKYRNDDDSISCVFPATLRDSGEPMEAVAKITKVTDAAVRHRLKLKARTRDSYLEMACQLV